jgi:hypothetical protein
MKEIQLSADVSFGQIQCLGVQSVGFWGLRSEPRERVPSSLSFSARQEDSLEHSLAWG